MHPVELVRVAVVGFEERLTALPWGGALVAHDLERLDDRGCVNGFGMSGPDLDNEIFGAVRDGWFKGWRSTPLEKAKSLRAFWRRTHDRSSDCSKPQMCGRLAG